MERVYKFTQYELSVVPESAFIIKSLYNYMENFNIISQLNTRLEQIIFSDRGMYLLGILYNITFDDELYGEVSNEYEEDVRYLISGRGDYLNKYKIYVTPYLQCPVNNSNISYINYPVYMYNTFYANELLGLEFTRFKKDDTARKINKHHGINEDELCKKYKKYYNEQGEWLLDGNILIF